LHGPPAPERLTSPCVDGLSRGAWDRLPNVRVVDRTGNAHGRRGRMPRPHGDTSAAALLGAWTDSDTAMQIVGTSLGIFGPDLLDPELALSSETPLRNALFDVLLS